MGCKKNLTLFTQSRAEFGRAGGGVISVSIKSGTNQFHGSAFEFLRPPQRREMVGYSFKEDRLILKQP